MEGKRLGIGLAFVNLVLLAAILASDRFAGMADAAESAGAAREDVVPVLRGRALEIVDELGQVRSRLNVEADGVVFRLMDRNGTIRVKLGADEGGSGLVLLDEATEPAVHIVARRVGTSARPPTGVTLRGAGAREQVIRP